MKANGSLRAKLEQRAELTQETYETAIGAPDSLCQLATEDAGDNPLRRRVTFNQVTSAAMEQALQIAPGGGHRDTDDRRSNATCEELRTVTAAKAHADHARIVKWECLWEVSHHDPETRNISSS